MASRRERWGKRGAWRVAAPILVSLDILAAGGCAGGGTPKKVCATFYASENLNLFDGEPHPITVYVYALESASGFEQASVEDLLGGAKPPGVLAPPVPITISPGEKFSFSEVFPAKTNELGLVADFFRAPGDPRGTLTQVVPARCGMRKPKLTLSPKDIYPK